MSIGNVVDSKIVELQFDNKDFESNAKTSMSTLDKLKKSLDFSKDSRGIDDVNSKLSKLNLSTLASGVESVRRGFTSLARDAVVFTGISRMVDTATASIKQFAKSLTTDQINAGWDKYAQKTSAVQTIMAATAKDFESTELQMAAVNKQLDKLNWFTDETSYGFLDMVSSIGKFTSNDVKLDDAVKAMEGIANWAGISGANVNEASRAMYNLSQAIAVGSVKLMDWKSIENANMATAEFKETALDTAYSLGILKKQADGTFKTIQGHSVSVTNFNQQLSDGWFTSEVLLRTLERYSAFTEELYTAMNEIGGDISTSEMINFVGEYKEGTLDMGAAAASAGTSVENLKRILESLSSETLEFGMKAFKAAQEAKTFGEAVESVKDAVSTGWMDTFEILFGDYTKAKKLWTKLAEDLWDIFASGGRERNRILREAFDNASGIDEKEWGEITRTGIASSAFVHAVRKAAAEHGAALENIESDEVWLIAALRNGLITVEDLKKAYSSLGKSGGEVDEALKSQIEAAKAADEEFSSLLTTIEKYGADDISNVVFGDGKTSEGYEELESAMDEVLKKLGLSQDSGQVLVSTMKALGYFGGEAAEDLYSLSNSELIALGYTEDQVKQLRLAQREGIAFNDIIDRISESHKSTGDIWTETLYNGLEALVSMAELVGEVWEDVFPTTTSSQIVDFVNTLHSGSERLLDFINNSEELRAILRGVFSVLDLIVGAVGTLFRSGFAVISGILEGLGINLLDVAAGIANVVSAIHDWVMENEIFNGVVSLAGGIARKFASSVRGFFDAFLKLPFVSKNVERFGNAFGIFFKDFGPFMSEGIDRIKSFIDRISSLDHIGLDNIGSIFKDFKDNVLDYFLNFPGFKALTGAFWGLVNDVKGALSGVKSAIWEKLEEIRQQFDGTFIGTVIGGVMDAVIAIRDALTDGSLETGGLSFGSVLETIFGALADGINAIADFLTNIDWGKVVIFAGVVTSLITFYRVANKLKNMLLEVPGVIEGIQRTIFQFSEKLRGQKTDSRLKSIAALLVSIAVLVGVLAGSIYLLSTQDIGPMWSAVGAVTILLGLVGGLVYLLQKFGANSKGVSLKISVTLVAIAVAVGMLADAVLKIDSIDPNKLFDDMMVLGAVIVALIGTYYLLSNIGVKGVGGFDMFLIVTAIKQMVDVLGAIDELELAHPWKDIGILIAVSAIIVLIAKIMGSAESVDVGGLKNAVSLVLIAVAIKILATILKDVADLSIEGLGKGLLAIVFLGVFITALAENLSKAERIKIGSAIGLLLVVGAIYALSTVVKELGALDNDSLFKGILAVSALGLLITGIASALAGAERVKVGSGIALVFIAVAVGIMSLVVHSLGSLDGGELSAGLLAVGAVSMIIVAIAKALAGADRIKIGSAVALILISAAVAILAAIVKSLGGLSTEGLGKGLLAVAFLGLLVTAIAENISKAERIKISASLSLLLIVAVIAIMASIAKSLGELSFEDLGKGLLAVAFLGLLITALAENLSKADKIKFGNAVGLLIITGAISVLSGVVKLLSELSVGKLAKGLVAIGLLAIIMATIPDIMSNKDMNPKTVLSTILLVTTVFVLASTLMLLAQIDAGSLFAAAAALSAVILFFALLGKALDGIKVKISSVVMMLAVIAVLGLVMFALASLPVENVLGVALAMSIMLGAMVGALALLSVVGHNAMGALKGIGLLVLFIASFAILGGVLGALSGTGVTDAILKGLDILNKICQKIGEVFVTLAEYLGRAIGAFLGGGIEEGFSHLGKIGEYLAEFSHSLQGVESLSFDNIVGILEALAVVFLASLVGFFNSILSIGPEMEEGLTATGLVAKDLEDLSEALVKWQTNMESIDEIDIPVDALAGLGVVEILAGLTGFTTSVLSIPSEIMEGESAVGLVCGDIERLAEALETWQQKMSGLGEITIPTDSIAKLMGTIALVSFAGFGESVLSILPEMLHGKTAVETISGDIEALASALAVWQEKMSGLGEIDIPTESIKTLVSAVDAVSRAGLMGAIEDFIANLFSDEDKTNTQRFAENTEELAKALGTWKTKMDEIGAIYVPTDIIDQLITSLKEIPKKGLGDIIKDFFPNGTDAEAFAKDAEQLGSALQRFSNAFSVEVDGTKLQTLVQAAVDLASVSNDLAGYTYTDDLSDFANKIANLGPQLASFAKDTDISESDLAKLSNISTVTALLSEACQNFSTINLSSGDVSNEALVERLKTNVGKLKFMIEALTDLDTSGVDSFVESLTKINDVDISSTMDQMSDAMANADMSESGSAMAESMAKGLGSSTAIGTAANDAANAAAKAVKTDSFQAQGVKLMSAMATGISIASGTLSNAVKTVISTAASNAGGYSQQFNDAGYDFARGLANGMARGLIMAMAAARALAQSVLNEVKKTLQERSPSKAAEDMGVFFDLGLINGLQKLAYRVGVAGSDVGESAKNGLANAIKSINDVIHDDIDGEPVIRPVLDLTNIQNGSGLLTDMLSFNDPIGVVGSLNAINSNLGMRSRSTNDDILAALNDLGRTIGSGRPGDTYNINGITYDDGSNISDAVKSLIRAARVERRS